MNNRLLNLMVAVGLCLAFTTGCCNQPATTSVSSSWKDELKTEIPLLGHRNWIVVTDMAYPLQTAPGIRTIYTDASYMDILSYVYGEIEKAPHIKAHVYQDKEFLSLDEQMAPGTDLLRQQMKALFGNEIKPVPHEELIARLDEVSRMFHVVILKSTLTTPYTTAFFELDCNYWDSTREEALQKKVNQQ
ncbi:MAG: hypothetical protein LBN71_05925 [Tannerella sp.]|jgi:hypothetical protein|nr:hypothetical protein [Tannerella sp.]